MSWLFALVLPALLNATENQAPPTAVAPSDSSSEADNDPSYFFEFPEKGHIRVASEQHSYAFALGGGTNLQFEPNTSQLTVVGLQYSGVGGSSWGFRQAGKDSTKGSSKYDDYRFNFAFREFNVYLAYSRYTGFYLRNTKDVDPSATGDYDLFPNLYAENIAVHFTYVVNQKHFSLAAVMDQTERQIHSGASWILGLSGVQTTFHNSGGPFIPLEARASYAGDGEIYQGLVRSVSFRAGFGGTWSMFKNRKWFMSGLTSAGVGPQQVTISTTSENYTSYKFFFNQFDLFLSAGWNGDCWYAGLTVFASQSFYWGHKAQIASELASGGLFIGTRL